MKIFVLGLILVGLSNSLFARSAKTSDQKQYRQIIKELKKKEEACLLDFQKMETNNAWGDALNVRLENDPLFVDFQKADENLADVVLLLKDQDVRLELSMSSVLVENGCELSAKTQKYHFGGVAVLKALAFAVPIAAEKGIALDVIRIETSHLSFGQRALLNMFEKDKLVPVLVPNENGELYEKMVNSSEYYQVFEEGEGENKERVMVIRANPADWDTGLRTFSLMKAMR